MGKYDNVTARELHEKKMEMMNDLGRKRGMCGGVNCGKCPLDECNNIESVRCTELQSDHFDEYVKIIMEYEPKVHWENVEVDTKIMVKNEEMNKWNPKHFAKFENGKVYAWYNGRAEFTSDGQITPWNHAKLYKGDL